MPQMPAHPLTHHEIFGLIGPFTQRGYHVDLAATNRLARCLVFSSRQRSPTALSMDSMSETLQLDNPDSNLFRLTRTLASAAGVSARLETEGADPERLLRYVEAIEPQRQFRRGPGFVIAYDYRLNPAVAGERDRSARQGPADDRAEAPLLITHACARVFDVTLELKAPTFKGEAAEISLLCGAPPGGDAPPLPLPRDLLAVLGRAWSPLRWLRDGWRGTLRLAGREPERSRRTERQFERAVLHLVVTLAESPARFHDRWLAARWRVFGRCAIPLLVCIGLIGATAALPRAHLAEHSALRMLIFNAPPLLMALFFCLREIPRIELPPVPRRSRAPSWPQVRPD
jgi:hypothetical protein